VVKEISQRSIEVGRTIAEDRPVKTELSPDVREFLNEHQYVLDPEFGVEERRAAVEAALTTQVDGVLDDVDFAGLDPRRGSRYRQYRFLTSGAQADERLTVPVGF
jgi:hypothetical protein